MGKFRRGINGNISELGGNRHRPFRLRKTIGYNEKGHQIYETIGYYATYVEAQQALFEYNKNPYDLSNNDLTLGEFVDSWFEMFSHKIHKGDKIELPDGSTGNETDQNSGSDNISDGNDESTERGESSQAEEVLNLVNQERKKQGLTALTLSSKLTSIANTKSKDMAVNKYFAHESPTYGSPFQMLQNYGVTYTSAGENIAAGQKTAQEVMNSWLNSSGHRANILNKDYTQLGVGYYKGGSYGTYWVQMFIKP